MTNIFSVLRVMVPLVIAVVLSGAASVEAATPYDRHEWHPKWSDFNGDCQDTRHELLIQFSLKPVTYIKNGCAVSEGLWLEPYSGRFFQDAKMLDVEHIVPLKWAHEHGGANWPTELKHKFAEDPENLWLVYRGDNRSKGAKGPDEWMPPYKPVAEIYIRRFVAIANKYNLRFTEAERRKIYYILHNS